MFFLIKPHQQKKRKNAHTHMKVELFKKFIKNTKHCTKKEKKVQLCLFYFPKNIDLLLKIGLKLVLKLFTIPANLHLWHDYSNKKN